MKFYPNPENLNIFGAGALTKSRIETIDGKIHYLGKKEALVLTHLVMRRFEITTQEDLLNLLEPVGENEKNYLNGVFYRLRKKVGSDFVYI